jgi:hypothetical protein
MLTAPRLGDHNLGRGAPSYSPGTATLGEYSRECERGTDEATTERQVATSPRARVTAHGHSSG